MLFEGVYVALLVLLTDEEEIELSVNTEILFLGDKSGFNQGAPPLFLLMSLIIRLYLT